MSALDKALQDMTDRRPWNYITKHHSQGRVYRALEKFEPHMEKLYSELCERVSNIEEELKVANDNIQKAKESQEKIETKNYDLRKERDQISTEILQLENEKNEVMSDLLIKTADLDDINMKRDELSKRHITADVLTQILESDISSHDDFLNRVKTDKEYRELVHQNRIIEESILEKHERKQEAAAKLEQLKSDALSEKNKLDEAKQLHQMWLNSIQVVNKAQQRGYSSEILAQLVEALFKISVKGEPLKSARRLLRRFEKIKEDIELDSSIINKTASLESLEQQYKKVNGALHAVADDALSKIKSVENAATDSITSVEEVGKKNIIATREQSLLSIKKVEQTSLNAVGNLEESSSVVLGNLRNDVSKTFMENSFTLKLAIEVLQKEILEWGDLKERAGQLHEPIKLATVLLGIQQDTEALLNIESAVIVRLLERIHLYIVRKWPGMKTKASQELSRTDWGISSVYDANLSSVSQWLVDALKGLERRGF